MFTPYQQQLQQYQYSPLMGNKNFETYNEEVPNSTEEGFTAVYRKKGIQVLKQTPSEDIRSIADLLRAVKTRHATTNGISEIIVETSKNSFGSDVETRSLITHPYGEVFETASALGMAILTRKLYFIEPVRSMKLVGIYSRNRYEWFVTDWACALLGITTVPLYDTLGVENISYCLNQTDLTTLFATAATINTLLTLKDLGKLKTLITFDQLTQEVQEKISKLGLELISYKELVAQGEKIELNLDEIKPAYDDIYTFSYTSGTTGPPKGVLLSHGNLLACMATFAGHPDFQINHNDHYLSYLPLPHVMERVISLYAFYQGISLYISCGNMLKLKDDCQFVRPTLLVSVPRIFNRIAEAVKARFADSTGISKFLIDQAVSKKLHSARTDGSFTNRFYDPLVFSKVRQGFGGRIRLLVSGSAPIHPDVLAFMKAIMCCPYIEGYGQTEDTAAVLFGRAKDINYGTLCQLGEAAEIRLADLPEMRYTAKDVDEQGKPSPRGEIQIRGPQVFKGYYKLEEMTQETITADGWLRTGDIAQLIPQRLSFKIIDRKKNIFKLQQGEYVAPDKVESVYMETGLLVELFLHGDSSQNFAVAVAVANKQGLVRLAEEKGINGSFEQLCQKKEVKQALLGELNRHGKKAGLYGFELAKNIYLETGTFLAKNILTNTMKLIRFEARQAYKQEIKALYEEGELKL